MDAVKKKAVAQKAIDWIEKQWRKGDTVYITTHLKSFKWTPESARKWKATGHMPFAISRDGDLLMARGRKYEIVLLQTVKVTAKPPKRKQKKNLAEAATPVDKSKSFLLHLLAAAKSTAAARKELAPLVASLKTRNILDAKEAAAFDNATHAILEAFATMTTSVAKKTVNVESKNQGIDGALEHTGVLAALKYISKLVDGARKDYAKIKPKDFG